MERMFMQIFERKDWIAAQLRQQVDSYAQSIASNMLAAGVDVPSWLWSAAAVPDLWNSRLQLGKRRRFRVFLFALLKFPKFRCSELIFNCLGCSEMATWIIWCLILEILENFVVSFFVFRFTTHF